MSPNKRASLNTPRRLAVSSKAKKSPASRTDRPGTNQRTVSKPQEDSEVVAPENAGKELRVNLVRMKFDEISERPDANSSAEEERDKDSAPPPVSNGEVSVTEKPEKVEECPIIPKKTRLRHLCINLQNIVIDTVETSEKKTEPCASPESSDKCTETSTANHSDFNILEIIKKYLPSNNNNDNTRLNFQEEPKLPNGSGGGDDILCLSSDCDEADEKTQPLSSSDDKDDDVFITNCYDSRVDADATTVRDFLDDAAEEGVPEDDPSDDGCEILDHGEPICLSESESELDDYDRSDSFICDDEEEGETETGEKIIIHENVDVSEIKDQSLQNSVKEMIDLFVLGNKRRESAGGRGNEGNHWEVDSADMLWYVEEMNLVPSDNYEC